MGVFPFYSQTQILAGHVSFSTSLQVFIHMHFNLPYLEPQPTRLTATAVAPHPRILSQLPNAGGSCQSAPISNE
jgi:hypothetical protein